MHFVKTNQIFVVCTINYVSSGKAKIMHGMLTEIIKKWRFSLMALIN